MRVMETPRPADAAAAPPFLPRGVQPLLGTLCHGSISSQLPPRPCWAVQQLGQLLLPDPRCPSILPSPPQASLCTAALSHPNPERAVPQLPGLPEQQQLLLPQPPEPRSLCLCSPGGSQARRESKILSSTLRFTRVTWKCGRGVPDRSRRSSRRAGDGAGCRGQ